MHGSRRIGVNILVHPVQVGRFNCILQCQYLSLRIKFLLGINQTYLMKVTEAFLSFL